MHVAGKVHVESRIPNFQKCDMICGGTPPNRINLISVLAVVEFIIFLESTP